LFKVLIGEPRFSDLSIRDAISGVLENRRTTKPSSVKDALWEVVEKCWQVQPRLRPTISSVVQGFVSQLDTEKPLAEPSYKWDKGITPILPSLLALHLSSSPTRLGGDQTLSITNEDIIVA
jgi:Protein tyrosine and serine/threonine kinase